MKIVRGELCATLQHRLEAMRKDHKRLMREALESTRDWYEDDISSLKEENGTEMQSLREVMEDSKSKAKKKKTEAEMTAMAAYINQAPKG